MSVIEKSVGDAYEAFNMGEAAKTKPLMAKAIAAAKKALKGAPTKEKSLLKALIAIGPDQYRVSMMKDAVMALQDYQLRGCSA
jgi:hypothetical protein